MHLDSDRVTKFIYADFNTRGVKTKKVLKLKEVIEIYTFEFKTGFVGCQIDFFIDIKNKGKLLELEICVFLFVTIYL